MTAAFDDIAFEDARERSRCIAAARGHLRQLRAAGAPLASRPLRETVPRRFYATHGSGVRSPAEICAALGAREELRP